MTAEQRPLSQLVAQGWEVLDYAFGHEQTEGGMDCFLLRRQKQHKVLKIRKKWFGSGFVVKEVDL